jgi:multidrug efflux system membrane fusion protein
MKLLTNLTLLLLLLLQLACGKEKKEQKPVTLGEDVVPVMTVKVDTSVRAEPIRVSGTVASLEEARLSFKIGGMISKVFVNEGQTVHKGQLLAILDQTEIDAQVNQARYASEKSERDLQRVQKMLNDTAATLEQLQNATTGYDVSQQNLRIATFNQTYSRIISPLDGTVTKKLINEGELTGPGTPALIITSSRKNDWVIRAGISDKDWARVKMGDRATLKLDAYPETIFPGRITNIAQAADPVSRLYEVEVRIDPNGKRLATGLYAKIELNPSQSRTYAVIPVEAMVEGNGNDGFVYVESNGIAKRLPVTIGYLDGDKVLITGGLDGISEVITSGSGFLAENVPVKKVKNQK